MSCPIDNQTWIIEAGDAVIRKKVDLGVAALSAVERLTYCLWVIDYSIRNGGGLDAANDLHPDYRREATELADHLGLEFTHETFSLPGESLPWEYLDRFDRICDEVKSA